MPTDPVDVVRKGLQAYADRGVFRGLDEVKARNRKNAFRFVWLGSRLLDFSLDARKGVLKFNNLLPNVPSNSILYGDLKHLLKSRSDHSIPKHRRVDPRCAEVSCTNRGGNVSIALRVKNNQYAYGLNKLVNLVHEIFVHLNDSDPDYMSENFDAPRE
ncbi:MAG: hypothetical protein AABN34_28510 [Acidobacteriota bacterium]